MKINEILEELQKEYNNNQDEIDKLKVKSSLIRINEIEQKALVTFAFSIIPWVLMFIPMVIIAKSGIIPVNLIPTLSLVVPASIGVIGQKLLFAKRKYKKKLKKYTNAKKEKDLMREETLSNIKINQLKFKNDIIEYIIGSLSLNSIFKKYEFQDNAISQIETNELDIAVTRSYLNNRFTEVRNKFNNKFAYGLMFYAIIITI